MGGNTRQKDRYQNKVKLDRSSVRIFLYSSFDYKVLYC